MNKTETHLLRLPTRDAWLEITEEPERVFMKVTLSKYGEFGDDKIIHDWLVGIFKKYDDDPRPTVMPNPISGEIATIYGGKGKNTVAVIQPPSAP